ncbi:helix-turn-helix domain-containing protein [Streptomyces sp. NPDC050509]|uniref:helix-turn-helix domain-containing protein n=1 Tax=Streptomyces sp. NPDC050509 TaxID=3365620 RepID=UPI003790911F
MAARTLEIGPAGRHVAQVVARLRAARGWDQRELAVRLGAVGRPVSRSMLGKIESAARRIDVDDLEALALALEVSVSALLPAEPDRSPATVAQLGGTSDAGPVEAALTDDIEALGDLCGMEPTHAAVAYRLARQMDGHRPVACEDCGSSVFIPNDARILPQLARELRATVAALVEGRAVDDDDDDGLDLGGGAF